MKSSDDRPVWRFDARRAFRVFLGVSFLVAALSAWTQIHGLVGDHGIFPSSEFFERLAEHWQERSTLDRLWRVPTILWFVGSHDVWLHLFCGVATVSALGITFNVAPRASAVIGWFAYLNIVCAGQIFFGYQWDALLLESLFLGAIVLTGKRVDGWRYLVVRVLLFKLIFLSGYVKLASNDPTWADWSALSYHYFTQPIPNIVAPYVAMLPDWFHRLSVLAMLVIELVLPFGLFAPRRIRWLSVGSIIVLQLAIAFTGTYGFFNLLTIALCFGALVPIEVSTGGRRSQVIAIVVSVLLALPIVVPSVTDPIRGFRTVNRYGLFAVMTTKRIEIEIDVSEDGRVWHPVEFQFKPTSDRSLRLTTLHMPRLDWQMWFEALGRCRPYGWFERFEVRLLEAEPAVHRLLEKAPLTVAPNHIRTRRVDYRFVGSGWETSPAGRFCPEIHL